MIINKIFLKIYTTILLLATLNLPISSVTTNKNPIFTYHIEKTTEVEEKESIEFFVKNLVDNIKLETNNECTKKQAYSHKNPDIITINTDTLPDGRIIAALYNKSGPIYFGNKKIQILNIKTEKCIQKLKGHKNYVSLMKALPNGNISTGSYKGTIKVWNLGTGECIRTLYGHESEITGIVHANNNVLLTSELNGIIKVWATKTYKCLATINAPNKLLINSMQSQKNNKNLTLNIIQKP